MHDIELEFTIAEEKDIPQLTEVMTKAFDDDSQRHLDKPKGGPPGYDNGDFFRTWLLPYKESQGYKILHKGNVIGGLIAWILPSRENRLGVIFVDPMLQNKGVGSRILQFMFETYSDAKSWALETPGFAKSNHKFYEKNGFIKIGEQIDKELPGEVSFKYKKIVKE